MTVFDQLAYAWEKCPHRLSIYDLSALLVEGARKNDKRPAWLKVMVPDDVVKNLWGKEGLRDEYLIVRIPREISERSNSLIILPNET